MKTDFNVLWIDDENASYDSVRDEIDFHLQDLGFRNKINFQTDANQIIDLVRSCNPFFIVLDYNLVGVSGDTFIQSLRNAECFHEVLFYTQGGFSAEQMSEFFRDPASGMALGVSFCNKADRKQHVTDLISLKATQVADLATQRGWIVADAIELEWQISDLLKKAAESLHICFGKTFDRILDEDRVDFGFRAKLLNGLIKDWKAYLNTNEPQSSKIARLNTIKTILSTFSTEVIEVRNTIAHQRSTLGPGQTILLPRRQAAGGDVQFDQTYIKTVRLNLIKHEDNLANLRSLLEAG